jgi:hypothetical protein
MSKISKNKFIETFLLAILNAKKKRKRVPTIYYTTYLITNFFFQLVQPDLVCFADVIKSSISFAMLTSHKYFAKVYTDLNMLYNKQLKIVAQCESGSAKITDRNVD